MIESTIIATTGRRPNVAWTPEPAAPWMEDALCAQTNPEEFFPDKGGSTRSAKRVCASCSVTEQCLVYALEHDERFGIWGGRSERERRAIKRATDQEPESKRESRIERVQALWREGLNDVEIAKRLMVSEATVYGDRQRLGLSSQRRRSL